MLNYFTFRSDFTTFKGQILAVRQSSPNGKVRIPYYVVQKEDGEKINLAISQTISKENYSVGQEVSVFRGQKGSYSRLLINFEIPTPIQGKVEAAGTFLFGTELFFSHLLIANGKGYEHVAFRPFRNQKRQLGLQLVDKPIIVEADQLLVVRDGRQKKWPN